MDYELPTNFDLIVIGTGIIESVVAAAASRIGKTVLHIDSNNYYGGLWASFNLEAIQQLQQQQQNKNPKESNFDRTSIKDKETLRTIGNDLFDLKDFSIEWHIPKDEIINKPIAEEEETDTTDISSGTEPKEDKPPTFTQIELIKESRKFNIDLTPKLQFARGDFVELLISSNIARYSEYRSVSRVLTWINNNLETVPCSRSDVFANNKVSVIEKRMLMKLFTSLDNEENKEALGLSNSIDHNFNSLVSKFLVDDRKSFETFLKERKLSSSLIHYVMYAISMSTKETTCKEGIERTKRFLNSLGRFGKTPFLFSMYGSGEITQAFCRLCAVFGGIYALNQPLNGLIFDSNGKFDGLLCGKQRIHSDYLVMSVEKSPKEFVEKIPNVSFISRAIFITDKSLMESEKEHLTLLLYPTEDGKNLRIILEMGTLTGTCPKNLYIVHMITKQISNPKDDFQDCIRNLFGDCGEKPKILWSSYFSIPDTNNCDLQMNTGAENVFICPGPDLDLDYDGSIKKAKDLFNKIYPNEEFLPRAPDPEEIVIEGEDETENEPNETTTEEETINKDESQKENETNKELLDK